MCLTAFMSVMEQRTCAIEMRSFSKNAGFTGTRLGFTVVPKDLTSGDDLPQQSVGDAVTEPSLTVHRTSSSAPVRLYTVQAGKSTDQRADCILHEQCKDHPQRFDRYGLYCVWWSQRSLHLVDRHRTK